MELDLEELARDWIAGISGEALVARVQDYLSQVEALTRQQQARGVLLTEQDPIEFAAAFFAAVLLDVPVILANPKWGAQEQAELGRLVSPAICFGRGFTCEDRGGVGTSSVTGLGSAVFTSEAPTSPEPGSILIPTGGSTGGVKLAVHTWDSLCAACEGVQGLLGGGPIDSCCVLPLYHVSGLMQLLRAYVTGGQIRFDEDEVAGRCLSYVPTQLQRALGSDARVQTLQTARAIFVGGAALPESLAQQARACQLPIIPVYGMTETAAMVAAVPVADFLQTPDAGAVAIGEARFQIEADGRLRIFSPALFQGYHGQPRIEGSAGYLTDDEARLDDKGRLHVIGRKDRLINSGGEKIDPREVEAAVAQLAGVEAVLAVGLPDPEWGQRLVVFYTGREQPAWKAQLREKLVNYKIPKELRWVDRLPLDEKGKVVGALANVAKVGASLVKTAEPKSRTTA
ncbi:AMP-binding protein, partial [Coraliomargarita sp. SDUM461003]